MIPIIFIFRENASKITFFNIKKVAIVGTSNFVSAKDIETIAKEKSIDKNIIFYNTAHLEKTLTEVFLAIKSVRAEKKFPSEIVIHIEERKPLVALKYSNGETYFLSDSQGYILGEVAKESLKNPVAVYSGAIPLKAGVFIDRSLITTYVELIGALSETNISFDRIEMVDDKIKFQVDKNVEVVLARTKSIAESINLLKEVVNKYNNEGLKLKRVDLRFDKVIVEY